MNPILTKQITFYIKPGISPLIPIWIKKANIIWEVLRVATVDGTIRVKDLIMQKNPKIPSTKWVNSSQNQRHKFNFFYSPMSAIATKIPNSSMVMSKILGEKNLSLESVNWDAKAMPAPKMPM